jgi:ribosomal protein L11 methyltransferase
VSYVALRFDVEAAIADAWCDALLDAGALSVDVADPFADTPDESPRYDERGEQGAEWWPLSRLTALVAPQSLDDVVTRATQALARPLPAHETLEVPEQDWVRATQAQFQPIRIDDHFFIVPSWIEPRAHAINIVLDPGLAFGTGSHPTTRLCLEWLRRHAGPGMSVLDYGCGSGILAIGAARLGAADVFGTDIDTQALATARDNATRNDVAVSFTPVDALPARRFDLVVANILANPLIVLAPLLIERVADGGRLALSGILRAQAPALIDAYAPHIVLTTWREEDGWVLLAGGRDRGR